MRNRHVLPLVFAFCVALAVVAGTVPGWGQATSLSFDFESDPVGQPPEGWSMVTYGDMQSQDEVGGYEVVAVDGGRALQVTGPGKPGREYNFVILGAGDIQDADLSVRLKFLSGMGSNPGATQPPAGAANAGLLFRYQDQANYYKTRLEMSPGDRATALLYVLSHADQIVAETSLPLAYQLPSDWHTMTLKVRGSQMTYALDGKVIFQGSDSALPVPGKVGFYVPRGSTVLFDDLKVQVASREPPAAKGATYTTPTGWAVGTVASGENVHFQASLAVNSSGTPHVATFDRAKGLFQHHWLEGSAWRTEPVHDEPYAPVPLIPDLPPFPLTIMEMGKDDQPQLIYIKPFTSTKDRFGGGPMIAQRLVPPPPDQLQPGQSPNHSWAVSPASPDQSGLGWYPGLFAVPGRDSTGFFVDVMNRKVKVSRPVADPPNPDEAWDAEAVAEYRGEPSKAAEGRVYGWVTSDGRIVLSYLDTQTTTLYVLTGRADGNFDSSSVDFKQVPLPRTRNLDRPNAAGKYPSSARDFNTGRVHTTHYEGAEQRLLYTPWYNGNFEATEVVDDEGAVGMYSSLVLDAAGTPHVAYCDMTDGTIRYAVRQNNKWVVQDTGIVGKYPTVKVGSDGKVHLVLFDDVAGSIRYAVR